MEQEKITEMMDRAPVIRAEGLSGDYRSLAEFNNVVLAGHQTSYGMEFVTWEWVQNHTSLWQGHYYGEDLGAARRDFATRSGLLPPERVFNDRQLAVIYDAAQHMTTLGLVTSQEQEKLLGQITDQIETALPQVIDLANELTQGQRQGQQRVEGMEGMAQQL